MNEFAILMRLLTRTGTPIGASMEDMLDALDLPEDAGPQYVYRLLGRLNQRLSDLGLAVRHNPLDHIFYIDTTARLHGLPEESGLPDRLAATLLTVITLAFQEGGWVSFSRVREFRKKSMAGVRSDLRELENLGYVEIDKANKRVRPGMKVPIEIDFEEFFRRLTDGMSS